MNRICLGLLGLILTTTHLSAQVQQTSNIESYIGFSYNIFLDSFDSGSFKGIETAGTPSVSFRYARSNMFAELRWQQFNFHDDPHWKDPSYLQYDAALDRYIFLNPAYQPVGKQNEFKFNYISLIVGPRFELLKHLSYEIGTSVDYLISHSKKFADFENNPYKEFSLADWGIVQEFNLHFYNRIQTWYNVTEKWRLSAYWEINLPLSDELTKEHSYGSSLGKSVYIEPVKNGAQFFLNFMIEYKL